VYDAFFSFFVEFLHGVIPCPLLSKGELHNFDLSDLLLLLHVDQSLTSNFLGSDRETTTIVQ
jgi:hypothetical protein